MPNITVFLDNNALIHTRPAVVDASDGLALGYGDLLSRMSRMARALMEQGVAKGDRVCIYLDRLPGLPCQLFCSLEAWGGCRTGQQLPSRRRTSAPDHRLRCPDPDP